MDVDGHADFGEVIDDLRGAGTDAAVADPAAGSIDDLARLIEDEGVEAVVLLRVEAYPIADIRLVRRNNILDTST